MKKLLRQSSRISMKFLREEIKRRKRVPTGADTRLITPYTCYLLRGFNSYRIDCVTLTPQA